MNFLQSIKELIVVKGPKRQERRQLLLDYAKQSDVEALFLLLGLLAKCDGRVSQEQVEVVHKFMRLHLAESWHETAKECFRRGQEYNLVKGSIVQHAFTLYCSGSELWIDPLQVLDLLFRVAFADRVYSRWEEFVIDTARATFAIHTRMYWALRDQLARRFGIEVPREGSCFADANDCEELRQQIRARKIRAKTAALMEKEPAPEETPYATLGLEQGANTQEIKKAYRALVKKYHPDSSGGSEVSQQECQKLAEHFLKVQAAYEALMC